MILKKINLLFFTLLILSGSDQIAAQSWQSKIVYRDSITSKLIYVSDEEGNRIPDFSYAGYKNGEVEIPDIPIVKTISPIEGDNTAHIQSAIDEVGFMPLGNNGFRGAVLLLPGKYQVNGTIRVRHSGVILRGSGDGEDTLTNTIIYGKGNSPHQRTIIVAGGGSSTKWQQQISGTKTNITTDTLFVGDRKFTVEDASKFNVGDNIIIYHPCTELWLQSINYGGTHSNESGAVPGVDVPWSVNQLPIIYNRYITEINGNEITIDAPVFNQLKRSLSQSYIYKYARTGLQTNIGIENLRVDIETAGGTDENHAWQAIDLYQLEDGWVRNCSMLHFGQSGIRCNTASRITVENCRAIEPVSKIEGERRYNFNIYTASQLILFKNCAAENGRHHYVSNGTSFTSGCVFLNCTSKGAYASSEGHRQWSNGILFDNHTELDGPRAGRNPILLALYNRGHYGTSHGWAIANSIAWNCDVANGYLIVQKPPTAQNYAIGCKGNRVTGLLPYAEFDEPEGYIEGTNQPGLSPSSLYLAQLEERMTATGIEVQNEPVQPASFSLMQNYPNPFNPNTKIDFTIKDYSFVTLKIFDAIGREIAVLVNEEKSPGSYTVNFSAEEFSTGIFYMRLTSGGLSETKKMIYLK